MKTWTTEMWLAGVPDEILDILTDPDAIARWAPIRFEVVELDSERLQTGSRAHVRGGLAGRQLEFQVDVLEAHDERLSLTASGPVWIDAEYLIRPVRGGSRVRASVSVYGDGLTGCALARGIEALLAAGMLRVSVARIGRELEPAAPAWRLRANGHQVKATRKLIGGRDGLDDRAA
jgi:hypothetical protein